MELKFTVQIKVQKPAREVFDAVYNPQKLRSYFLDSDGPLDEGRTLNWTHSNDSGTRVTFPVTILKTVPGELLRFTWAASEGLYDPKAGRFPRPAGYDNTVEMTFEELKPGETLVKVVEGTWRSTPDGLQSSYQNCQGWMQMICSLKGYLEYGINLRKGSF